MSRSPSQGRANKVLAAIMPGMAKNLIDYPLDDVPTDLDRVHYHFAISFVFKCPLVLRQ